MGIFTADPFDRFNGRSLVAGRRARDHRMGFGARSTVKSMIAIVSLALAMGLAAIDGSAADDGAATITPAFGWPESVRVPVRVAKLKKGNTMQAVFTLVGARNPADGTYLVTPREFEIVQLNGEVIDTPGERAEIAPVQALSSLAPSFRVSDGGELLSLEGFDIDRLLSELRAFIGAQEQLDAEKQAVLDRIFAQMRTPAMQRQIAAKTGDDWAYWVTFWRHAEFAEGETVVLTSVIPMFGTSVEQQTRIHSLGPVSDCVGCVRLRAESLLDGPEFKAAFASMMRRQVKEMAGDRAAGLEDFLAGLEDIRRRIVIEAITAPATLMPRRVMVESRTILRAGGQPPKEQVEKTTWTFDWPGDSH